MQKNLTARTVVIVCDDSDLRFRGHRFPTSGADLVQNLKSNIRLGSISRAAATWCWKCRSRTPSRRMPEQTVERLKESFRKQSIHLRLIDATIRRRWRRRTASRSTSRAWPATEASALRSLVNDGYPDWTLADHGRTPPIFDALKPTELIQLKKDTVERSIQTISNRINTIGVTEPSVQQYGRSSDKYEILVQLPGVDDPQQVKDMIGTVANLAISAVQDGPFASREAGLAQHGGVLPPNTVLDKSLPRGGVEGEQWYLVSRIPVITGRQMRNARAEQGDRRWETGFTLSPDGGRSFGTYTEANVGNKLAVVLDKQIVSVATIESRIEDSGRITNLGSQEEATELANFLKSGSLPAGVKYNEERSIGPSLGADSIHAGIVAGIAGLLAVVTVMLVYYKRSGINAVLALILNTVLLMAALSYFHAVLTLPGIAGVILTIGMAVDSNVLIFERIREELRAGKAVIAAVDTGFSKAWWTIVDTHVTTVVSCAFLFLFGEGPVRGFAVTLVIGLIANVFTAVFVSKTIFDYELSGKRRLTELSI
jgi:preprotein translocase subunit SecD